MKKHLRFFLILALVAILFAGCGKTEAPAAQEAAEEIKLYWNVDQAQYAGLTKTGYTARVPRSDGYYYVRFAVDGVQVELPIENRELVDIIDAQQVCGLKLDENGIIVDVLPVSACTGGIAANNYYVSKVEGNTLTVNMLGDYSGASYTLTMDEETEVYNVGTADIMCGLPTEVEADDTIYALWNMDRTRITHIFAKPYIPPGDVYWNITRYYDSASKISTRQPDALGNYTFEMSVNGERVALTTKDLKLVNTIDSKSLKCMALTFNEDGTIASYIGTGKVTHGSTFGSWCEVIAISGNKITVKRVASGSNQGQIYGGIIMEGCQIINVTGTGSFDGEFTDVRVGDTVHCLTDSRGQICHIFVVDGRLSGCKMYWNVDRKWDKVNLTTKRRPDKDGWYSFKMAVDGKHVTVRTNDKTMADTLDKNVCIPLELDGDVVVRTHTHKSAYGGNVFASWYKVDSFKDNTLTASRDGKTVTGVLAENCEIYNTTSYATIEGEKETVIQAGDTVHCFRNKAGEIALIYVVGRQLQEPAYWNVNRMYDSAAKVSTRTPDAEGWYHITLAVAGQQKVFKTKDKAMVDSVDAKTCMILETDGDVITKVYTVTSAAHTSGGLWGTYYKVTAIDRNVVTATNGEKTITILKSSHCEIYDVSNLAAVVGEKTTLRVGDTIHSMKNYYGKLGLIYVTGRALPEKEFYCDHCDKTLAFKGWAGGGSLTESGHYYLYTDVENGNAYTFGSADKALDIVLCLNGKTYQTPNRTMMVNHATTFSIIDPNGGGMMIGGAEPSVTHSGVIAIISGKATLNIYGGTIKLADDHKDITKGGVITASGNLNLYGGTIIGGDITGNGGTICVSANRTFNMYGGTVKGGSVSKSLAKGGNIYNEGTMNLYGGTIEGGKTTFTSSHGGNIYNAGTLNVYGGTITGGKAENGTHGGNIYSNGAVTISGGKIENGKAGSGKGHDVMLMAGTLKLTGGDMGKVWLAVVEADGNVKLSGNPTIQELNVAGTVRPVWVEGITGGKVIWAIGSGDTSRVIATGCSDSDLNYFQAANGGDLLNTDGALTIGPAMHRHCFCQGAEETPEGHVCDSKAVWQSVTKTTTISTPGYYYLDWTGLNAAALTINAKDVHLCLNGANIRAQTTITLKSGASLTVCDCSEEQGGTIMTTRNTPVTVPSNTTFTLYSGIVTGTYAPTTSRISVRVTGGTFNMYGGKVADGCSIANTADYVDTNTHGGNVQITAGTFNFYGGIIENGKADKFGGNVSMLNENAHFNMYGGIIRGGTAGTHGGNIGLGNGQFTMYGGVIENGTAGTEGKNISVYNLSTAKLLGGVIKNGGVYAETDSITLGGNAQVETIYLYNAKLTISTDKPFTGTCGILLYKKGVFAVSETDVSGCFTSTQGTISWDGTTKELSVA